MTEHVLVILLAVGIRKDIEPARHALLDMLLHGHAHQLLLALAVCMLPLLSECSLTAQKSATITKLVSSLHNFDAFWGKLELDEKKMILRSIISQIRAGDGKVEVDFIL